MCQRDNWLFNPDFNYTPNHLSSNVNEPVRMRTKKMIDLELKRRIIENRRHWVYGINID